MPDREPKPWPGGNDTAFATPERFEMYRAMIAGLITQAHGDGCDIGELLSLAVTLAAQETGGMDDLLKFRLGSWEATAVRGLYAEFDG